MSRLDRKEHQEYVDSFIYCPNSQLPPVTATGMTYSVEMCPRNVATALLFDQREQKTQNPERN